ncbi:MAG: DUF2997 domain-containing protein [Candidatus Woesearchaeota archaeon]|jgi:hypothetical protein
MSKRKEITIRIPPDGSNITIDQDGMIGKECSDNVKEIISKMGKLIESKKKSEYYKKTKDVHIDVQGG